MGKIFIIMGRSCSGKSSVLKGILEKEDTLKEVIQSTSRPIRPGEVDGVTYNFVTPKDAIRVFESGSCIYSQLIKTVDEDWYYYYPMFELGRADNLALIGNVHCYKAFASKFGNKKVVPILITLRDRDLLMRGIERESYSSNPNYREVCRRFLSDSEDYEGLNIKYRVYNDSLSTCVERVLSIIKGEIRNEASESIHSKDEER